MALNNICSYLHSATLSPITEQPVPNLQYCRKTGNSCGSSSSIQNISSQYSYGTRERSLLNTESNMLFGRKKLTVFCKNLVKDAEACQVQLPPGLSASLLPEHVAIIMDGNSRWAQRKGLPQSAGHVAGTKALTSTVQLCCAWGIKTLTVFAFSSDNWLRPKKEVDFLMNLFQDTLRRELKNFQRENIRFSVIGDLTRLSDSLYMLTQEAEHATKDNTRFNFNVAVSYSGRSDILQACQKLAKQVGCGQLKPEDINELMFEKELETSCAGVSASPDLLIRTSGEKRLSNFLLWQLAYTELFFTDSFWPDFGESQFKEALLFYQHRHRRFGKRISENR